MNKKVFFITLEGLEGSGKSSVIRFLEKLFRKEKISFKVFREPGSTRIGEKIRGLLLDKNNKEISAHTELLLYLAARTQLIEEKLIKALSRYDVVICDRFFDSTLVYPCKQSHNMKFWMKIISLFCRGQGVLYEG